MLNKIWSVYGVTGEWEDRRDWDTYYFTKECEAVEFKDKLNGLVRKVEEEALEMEIYECEALEETNAGKELSKLDPHACIDYTGLVYYIKWLENYEKR